MPSNYSSFSNEGKAYVSEEIVLRYLLSRPRIRGVPASLPSYRAVGLLFFMPRLTKLGLVDICLVVIGALIVIASLLFGRPLADASILPTIINGVSTVTGIITAITSSLIVYTLSVSAQAHRLQKGSAFNKYSLRSYANFFAVFISLAFLVFTYEAELGGDLKDATSLAVSALLISILNLSEFLAFFISRLMPDMERWK